MQFEDIPTQCDDGIAGLACRLREPSVAKHFLTCAKVFDDGSENAGLGGVHLLQSSPSVSRWGSASISRLRGQNGLGGSGEALDVFAFCTIKEGVIVTGDESCFHTFGKTRIPKIDFCR